MQRGLFTLMDWLTGKNWHVRRELKKWLKQAPNQAHVLDAGTGYGHHAWWLSEQRNSLQVLAIDPSHETVARGNSYARETGRLNVFFKSVTLDTFDAEAAFDLILCTDSITQIADPSMVLTSLYTALRENGFILATVKRRPAETPPAHVAFGFEMGELKELFRTAGFKKVKAHYTNGAAGGIAQRIGVDVPLALLRFSRLLVVLMPIYFLFAIPIVALLNWVDSHSAQQSGQGILLLARK